MKIGAEGQIFPPCEGVRNFSPPCEGARNVSPPCEGGVGGVWGWLARATLPGHRNPPLSPLRKGGRGFRRRFAQQFQDEQKPTVTPTFHLPSARQTATNAKNLCMNCPIAATPRPILLEHQ